MSGSVSGWYWVNNENLVVADGKMIDDREYWDRLELAERVPRGWLERRIVQAVSRRATKDLPKSEPRETDAS